MTVIAYRDGIIASDSSVWLDDTFLYRTKKIFRMPNGSLCGFWGKARSCSALRQWLLDPESVKASETKGGCGMLIEPSGLIRMYYNGTTNEVISNNDYVAGGAGCTVALGALFCGASAADAVRAAIHHDVYARAPVQTLRLKRKK